MIGVWLFRWCTCNKDTHTHPTNIGSSTTETIIYALIVQILQIWMFNITRPTSKQQLNDLLSLYDKSCLGYRRALWGNSFYKFHLEEIRQTHQLHVSLTPPQFLCMTPWAIALHYWWDFLCWPHLPQCWLYLPVGSRSGEGEQLMPRKKRETRFGHINSLQEAMQRASTVVDLLLA